MSKPLASLLILVVALLCLGACQGAIWGNLGVLALTLGIFFGTVLLGHPR